MTNILRKEWRRTEGFRIVLVMAAAQTVSAAILIVITILVLAHLNDVSTARMEAAKDSCVLLVGLVNAATPPSQQAEARAYKNHTPLKNCNTYAHTILSPHRSVVPNHKH